MDTLETGAVWERAATTSDALGDTNPLFAGACGAAVMTAPGTVIVMLAAAVCRRVESWAEIEPEARTSVLNSEKQAISILHSLYNRLQRYGLPQLNETDRATYGSRPRRAQRVLTIRRLVRSSLLVQMKLQLVQHSRLLRKKPQRSRRSTPPMALRARQ